MYPSHVLAAYYGVLTVNFKVNMGEFVVRKAAREDIPSVLSLLRELAAYEGKLDRVQIDEALLAEHAFGARACIEILLGVLDGSPVSYAIFFPHFSSYRGRPWLYLEDLYVQAGARGQGVGRSMMAHLAELTLSRAWAGMAWGVLDWNESAIAFYQGLGAEKSNGHISMELAGDALLRAARTSS
jgi:GNAT superfamily N-acetyltransferase